MFREARWSRRHDLQRHGLGSGDAGGTFPRLEELWGAREARTLHAQLVAARTSEARFATLERAMIRHATTLERTGCVRWAVRELTRARKVGDVTDAVGMSGRGFIEAFRRETGYTPKVFARVQRFQRLLRRVHGHDDVDWPDVAVACGYYDQSHLIRDPSDSVSIRQPLPQPSTPPTTASTRAPSALTRRSATAGR